MRILVISQYFWPETFRINDIVKHLKENNHHVDILTGEPNYPEGKLFFEYIKNKKKFSSYYGASIFRVPVILRGKGNELSLLLNYISFIFFGIVWGFFLLRKKKYDIVFSFATSPLTSSLPAVFFSKIKSSKSLIWVLDLWPDILLELKIIKNKFLYKIIELISRYIYNNFDYILSQSKSFQQIISSYSNRNNIYFPSWSENINENKSNESKYNGDKSFKIVFTGNVGEAQNFDNVIQAAKILKNHHDIKWIIVGSGRVLEKIKKIVEIEKMGNFILEGKKPLIDIGYYHSIADVLLISLKSGKAVSSTIPGKLQTYLESNKFILGMIEGESKKIIEDAGIGCCVDPNSPEDLVKEILYLKKNPEIINKINNSFLGSKYVDKNFNKKFILNTLIANLNEAFDSLERLTLVKNPSKIPFDRNFALSGLNLAFLGFLSSGVIKLNKYLLNWPDGIFKRRFFGISIPKVSGLDMITNIKIPNIIENIYILGSLTKNSKEFLVKKFYNFKLIHIDLPYGSIQKIYKFCPKNFTNKDLIICTLPTPKQEQLSELIAQDNKYFKIICIGGAIAMASGEEMIVPKILNKLNLEFLWRLRTDSKRRVMRLLYSFYFYLYGELTFKFKRIKTTILD